MVLLDSYSETNTDSYWLIQAVMPTDKRYTSDGQCFMTPNDGVSYRITSAKFYMNKVGPSGNVRASLYAMTGTYGVNGRPTGSALATSDEVSGSDIPTGSYALITFDFPIEQQYLMSPNTAYCIDVHGSSGTFTNNIWVGRDQTSGTHSGNGFTLYSFSWWTAYDTCFYVYGAQYPSITKRETLQFSSVILSPRFQYLNEIVNLFSRVWTNPFWIFERTSLSDLFWRVNPFFLEGFESNSFLTNGWTTYTRCSIVQNPVHHGGYAVRIHMVNGITVYLSKSISSTRHLSVRCYFRMSNFPSGTEFKIIDLRSGSNSCGRFTVTSSYWRVYGTYSNQFIYSPTPQLDTWYGIELEYHQVSGTTYRVKGYLNGVQIADITDTYNDWAVDSVYFQYGSNASYTVFYDDIAFDYNSIGSTFDPVGSFGRSCYERLTATKNIQQVGTFGSSLELQYNGALILFPYSFTSPRILYRFGLRCTFGGNYYHKAVVYKTEGANLILYAEGPSAYLAGDSRQDYWFPSFSPPVYLDANTTYLIGFFRDGPGFNYPAQGQGTSTTMYRSNPGGYPNPPYYFEGYSTSGNLYGICVSVAEIGETFRLNIFKTFSQLLSLLDFFLSRKTLLEILNLTSSMIKNISKNLLENLSFNDFLRRGSRLLEILFLSESLSKRILKRMEDELISLLDDLRKNVSKRIGEMFSSIDSIVKSIPKFFSEEISLLPLIAQFRRWILDEMHFSDLIRSFGEILGESMRLSSQPFLSIRKVLRDTLNLIELIFPGLIPRIRKIVKLLYRRLS